MRSAPLHRRGLLALAALLAACPALAAEIRVLGAGAVEPGLEAAVAGFRAAAGGAGRIAYATAPRLRERMLGGEAPDLLVAPFALLEELAPRLAGAPDPPGPMPSLGPEHAPVRSGPRRAPACRARAGSRPRASPPGGNPL